MRTTTFSTTRFAGGYFLLQGLAIVGWWVWLLLDPSARSLFLPAGAGQSELLAFALPDLVVSASGSLVASLLFVGARRWFLPIAWLTAGSVIYATLYCVLWAILRDSGWLNVVPMSLAALGSTIAALDGSAEVLQIFRRARPGAASRHQLETLAQIALFWSFFLVVVPLSIRFVEMELAWPSFAFPGQRLLACALLALFSALGLASGLTMAGRGDGTPLPFDAPNRLVVAGPYAWVRNPMVVAGLGQGTSVGLWLGSWAVLVYVIVGGAIWSYLVRPAEEADLLVAFGEEYLRYRSAVRCWIPRTRAYRPRDAASSESRAVGCSDDPRGG